jgi:tetratricopeptide (TPR) repeat protein
MDRTDEMDHSAEMLRQHKTVGIFGMPGIGKTTLAVHAAAGGGELPDGYSYHLVGTTLATDLIAEIAERFGNEAIRAIVDPKARLWEFGRTMSGKRALLVLDDVQSSSQVQDILDHAPSCAILVTSHHQLALNLGYRVNLGALPQEHATNLYHSRCNMDNPDQEFADKIAEICSLLGNLPLAIDLAAKLLITGRTATLEQLLCELQSAALARLQFDNQSVRAVFDVGFSSLLPEDRHLFASLGAFAGDSFSGLAAAAAVGKTDVRGRLGELVAASLLNRATSVQDRYHLHPLLKQFAQEQLAAQPDATEIQRRAADYLLQWAEANQDDFRVLEPEKANISGAMEWCYEQGEWAIVLAFEDALVQDGMRGFLGMRGYWDEQEHCLHQALKASQQLGDRKSEAESLHTLGMTQMHRSNWDAAEDLYRSALEIWQELDDQIGIAGVLHELGRIAGNRGDYDEAIKLLERSRRIKEEFDDILNLIVSLECLAGIYVDLGEYDTAAEYYQRCFDMPELAEDKLNQAMLLHDVGYLAAQQSDYDRALEFYGRSLAMAEEMGNESWIATNVYWMGLVAETRGDIEEARRLYLQSGEIREKLGDISGLAAVWHALGMLEAGAGRYDLAEDYVERSREINQTLDSQAGVAGDLHDLGYIALQQGRLNKAKAFYQTSLEIAAKLGEKSRMAATLHELGRLAREQHDYENAVKCYQASLKISRELGDQLGTAATLQTLGIVLADTGDHQQARSFLDASLTIAERLQAPYWIALNRASLGYLAQADDPQAARQLLSESLATFEKLGSPEQDWVRQMLANLRPDEP